MNVEVLFLVLVTLYAGALIFIRLRSRKSHMILNDVITSSFAFISIFALVPTLLKAFTARGNTLVIEKYDKLYFVLAICLALGFLAYGLIKPFLPDDSITRK